MGDMFRSEEMSLCQLFLQPEAAYSVVAELGEAGVAQFRDLNPDVNALQRKFIQEVRRAEELERKITYIVRELKKDSVDIPEMYEIRTPNPRQIIDLEAHLEKTENEIQELSENNSALYQNFVELSELKFVLERTQTFFTDREATNNLKATGAGEIETTDNQQLGFVAGVISRERVIGFERMLWRISRGNVFLRQQPLDEPFIDPKTGEKVYKIVFVAFFQGAQLKSRVKKVCAGYHASLYPCPSAHDEREDMLKGVRTRIEDLNMVLNQTKDQRQRVLVTVAKEVAKWIIMIKKIKAIYHTLNLFNMDVSQKCLIAECWVPVKDLDVVQNSLNTGSSAVGSTIKSFMNVIHTKEDPPTYTRTNKFTRGFQNLIEAYGIASYREVNPALYTVITFPFLFAIMFGDLGHGLLMLCAALWMVLWEKELIAKRINSEIWNIFFGGRYIILLMALFSCYTGFIYNDIFSKSMNIFGSAWQVNIPYEVVTNENNKEILLDPETDALDENCYIIGLDPVWQLATNKIIFLNSYKMKLSIIFGVVHMVFGVCMSVINHNHFRRRANIILEFVPQVVFLILIFGYMVFMMFFKWLKYGPKEEIRSEQPACAPSVLIMFINMMLFKSEDPLDECDEFMFDFQKNLQTGLVLVSVICIPWMLLAKPFYVMSQRKKKAASAPKEVEHTPVAVPSENDDEIVAAPIPANPPVALGGHDEHEEEPISEVFIHQAIHTIEYVLSTVSHTASYLRLWALSLAHAQLSEVLWNMVFQKGFIMENYGGAILVYFVFGAWALGTVAILVGMEGLSAFLHTLRLHWVEFMSKFYEGLGYAFEPFCFKRLLAEEEDD